MTIPKVIHYCWFGGKQKTELMHKCINSWKTFMPNYVIKEWNESSYVPHEPYEKQALDEKAYAFVSDIARLRIIYEYGGIYLDTDVELLRSLEPLLKQGGYLAHERHNTIATGLGFAAPAKSPVILAMLREYEHATFRQDNGKLDKTPCPVRNTNAIRKLGINPNNSVQKIHDVTIYPQEYFCPLNNDSGEVSITENTYSIHHYGYSWADEYAIKVKNRKRIIFKLFPNFCAQTVFIFFNKLCRIFKK